MQTLFPILGEAPLDLLRRCEGYYQCPKDPDGKRLGPLVGYAAKYDNKHHWVGDEYANFAKAERHGPILHHIVDQMFASLQALTHAKSLFQSTGFCGAPEGGKALANALASWSRKQYIFPEKKVLFAETRTSREVSELHFDRHEPKPRENWWIVEDVCNNFSTTKNMIELIENFGASVTGIICFLNRSPDVEDSYLDRPVISLVRKVIPQYRQGDPFVAEDVLQRNVIWKPKTEWSPLAEAMAAHP
jgi:adenine/guanine phosphoribosyltransferase-like PRPP-binding protein